MSEILWLSAIGTAAGAVNGLFGAGGGLVLVPLLGKKVGLQEDARFPTSIAIMAPVCITALVFTKGSYLQFAAALPYLLGSAVGGLGAGLWGQRIPTVWLHRILGCMILWGGVRYLC